MDIRKRLSRHPRIAFSVVVGACGIAAVWISLAASSASSGLRIANSREAVTVRSASTVAPSLIQDFSVLRQTGGTLPVSAQSRLSVPGGIVGRQGLDLAAARSSEVDGLTVWIIPGASEVCEYMSPTGGAAATPSWWGSADPVGTCGPVAESIKGNLVLWHVAAGGEVTMVGIAPDGNSAVRIAGSNGSTMSVPVANNVYVARLQHEALRSATAVELRGPEGEIEHIVIN
ncbi:MAG: hypothetical protein ACYDA6_11195 [Solirubrobacteraceae bacterium]